MSHPPIRFVRQGNEGFVLTDEALLLRFTIGEIFYGAAFQVRDLRFHPSQPARFCNLIPAWTQVVPPTSPQRVRLVDEKTAEGIRITVVPEEQGDVEIEDVYEFLPDRLSGGWVLDHRCRLTLRRDVPANEFRFHVMQDPRGVPTVFWEFDDPLPLNAAGPSVPMKEDWLGVYEPTVGPDTFRKHWRREVETYFFQEPSGRVRTIPFHRALVTALTQYNRRAVAVKPGGFAGIVMADGAGVLFEYVDRRPVFTHLCEWGNDIHFWQALRGNPERLVLRKGRVLEARYRMREIPPDAVEQRLDKAVPIEPTREEWKRVEDLPVYEEPVNRFATSWRDDPTGNGYPWVPGFGAFWDRKVGRRSPGSLKLTSPGHNLGDAEGIRVATWRSHPVGASTWMNPLVPRACYRLSGYVRVRPSRPCFFPVCPTVSITFHKYSGPATFSLAMRPEEVFAGTIREVRNLVAMKWNPDKWYRIEVISGPVTGNVMSATLGCHLSGGGEAWFDELAFEKL